MPDSGNSTSEALSNQAQGGIRHQKSAGFVSWCVGGEDDPPRWLIPLQPFLAMMGGGDSRIGAGLAAILVVTALVCGRSLGNEFVADDVYFVVHNRYLADWSFPWKSLFRDALWFEDPLHLPQSSRYRPLWDIWLWINFQLFGLHSAGWHASSIAIHLLVVWLVFRVASLLSGDRRTGLLAAALFALMPAHAEAIAWPAAVAGPLATAFQLGAFEFYLRRLGASGADGRRLRWLVYSLGLFAGALLSYEVALLFPVLLAAHGFILGTNWTDRQGVGFTARMSAALTAAWPYALEAAAYLRLRSWVIKYVAGVSLNINSGTPQWIARTMLWLPGDIAGTAMLLIMPWQTRPLHFPVRTFSIAVPGFYLPVLELAALCGAGWLLFRRNPRRRLYLFCAAWIPIPFGLIIICCKPENRYLYFPSVGFCVMAADFAIFSAQGSQRRAKAVWVGVTAVLIGYAVLLFFMQRFWQNDIAFLSHYIEGEADDPDLHYRLGLVLEQHSDFSSARREFEAAITLAPKNGTYFYELGRVDGQLGDWRTAAREFGPGNQAARSPRAEFLR